MKRHLSLLDNNTRLLPGNMWMSRKHQMDPNITSQTCDFTRRRKVSQACPTWNISLTSETIDVSGSFGSAMGSQWLSTESSPTRETHCYPNLSWLWRKWMEWGWSRRGKQLACSSAKGKKNGPIESSGVLGQAPGHQICPTVYGIAFISSIDLRAVIMGSARKFNLINLALPTCTPGLMWVGVCHGRFPLSLHSPLMNRRNCFRTAPHSHIFPSP